MPDYNPPPKADIAQLSKLMMRRQAGLSLRVASVFLVLILGLPLVNRFAPSIANYPILGFPASWLFLAVIFYPITVALSVYFVRKSDRIESDFHQWDAGLEGEAR
jgi:uncharacterized membrane protein (DUF485 family)